MSTKVNLVRNKLRAMGLKMSHVPEGENIVDEGLIGKAIQGVGKAVGGAENVATGAVKKTAGAVGGVVKGTAGAAKKVVKTVGGAVSGGTKSATQKESNDIDEGAYHRIDGEYEGKDGKKERISGKFLKLPRKVAKGVKRNTDHRHEFGKIKDAVTDTLGITNTKRDGVRKHDGIKGAFQMQNGYEPEGEVVDENRMAAYTAGAGEGSPASRPRVSQKTADMVGRRMDKDAFGDRKKKQGIRLSPTKKYSGKDKGKVVKRANTTGRGTPTQYRKSHEDPDMGRYQQKVTQGTGSMKNLKKEDLDPAVLNALNALDSYMKNESVGSAVDKGLSAGADVAKVAGKVATGGVKVASKVVKGAAKTAAHVAGTPIGAVKAVKKGFKSGTQAESTDPAVLNALSALDTYMQSNDHLHGSVLAKKK